MTILTARIISTIEDDKGFYLPNSKFLEETYNVNVSHKGDTFYLDLIPGNGSIVELPNFQHYLLALSSEDISLTNKQNEKKSLNIFDRAPVVVQTTEELVQAVKNVRVYQSELDDINYDPGGDFSLQIKKVNKGGTQLRFCFNHNVGYQAILRDEGIELMRSYEGDFEELFLDKKLNSLLWSDDALTVHDRDRYELFGLK
jgi:hypothetical protein